jgi:hypothetical protein
MSVNPEWTLDEAMEANRAALAENPDRGAGDPTLPFWQWYALRELGGLHSRFKQGDRGALLDALHVCAVHELAMPAWVAESYLDAYRAVLAGKAASWDEVFSPPHPKGAHLNRIQKERKNRWRVYSEVSRLHDAGEPLDEALFGKVGKRLGLGKTATADLYYQTKRRMNAALHHAAPILDLIKTK